VQVVNLREDYTNRGIGGKGINCEARPQPIYGTHTGDERTMAVTTIYSLSHGQSPPSNVAVNFCTLHSHYII